MAFWRELLFTNPLLPMPDQCKRNNNNNNQINNLILFNIYFML